jgi:hypothetical protein
MRTTTPDRLCGRLGLDTDDEGDDTSGEAPAAGAGITEDERILHRLGYAARRV